MDNLLLDECGRCHRPVLQGLLHVCVPPKGEVPKLAQRAILSGLRWQTTDTTATLTSFYGDAIGYARQVDAHSWACGTFGDGCTPIHLMMAKTLRDAQEAVLTAWAAKEAG